RCIRICISYAHPLSCAGTLVLWCAISTTTTRTASHARTYPPPPMSAGALAGCVCNERASERWVLQWWRRGEVLEGEQAACGRRMGWSTSWRHRIFEDAGCGRASILSTRRSKARRPMSGRRQICDWRCYRHGGRHVWVRLVVIQCFSISRRMSSRRTCGWWGAVLVAASYLGVSGRLCSALLCDR
ncbi:hypothetical protein B0H13DRAFT_2036431, partial [Mycena leptocephala]